AEVLLPDGTSVGDHQRVPVTYPCPPKQLVGYVRELAGRLPAADRVAIGFPGMVRAGRVLSAPHFVTTAGPGTEQDDQLVAAWTGYVLAGAVERALGAPVRLGNDADVAGLSVIKGQ